MMMSLVTMTMLIMTVDVGDVNGTSVLVKLRMLMGYRGAISGGDGAVTVEGVAGNTPMTVLVTMAIILW